MVRSHLEYCNSAWSTYRKSDIEALEKVQKRATKILPHLKYSERFRVCKLPTLHYRCIRGDMTEILTGKYDMRATPTMLGASSSVTRGHNLRLNKFRVKYDLRKYYFTSRVVNVWNSLSSFVVSADSVIFSKIDLTTFGRTRILSMIIKQLFTEPETEVKWYFDSIEEIVIIYIRNRLRGTFACVAPATLYVYVLMSESSKILLSLDIDPG